MSKTAIVTGGARGIGKAAACAMAKEGTNIMIVDLLAEVASATAAEIAEKYGVKTFSQSADISDNNQVKAVTDKTVEIFGSIDVLVNCAGIRGVNKSLLDLTTEDWQLIFNINLMGTVNCIKAVAPIMKKQKYGRIINISSLSAENGGIKGAPQYAAMKAAIICITKSLSVELGPDQITVNAVAPGWILTDMTSDMNYDDLAPNVPLKRIGTPEEVGDVIAFLAGEGARYITGSTLDINGGVLRR